MTTFNHNDTGESTPLIQSSENTARGKKYDWIAGAFLLINTTLGAGILAFPTAFYEAGGIINTLCIQAIIVIFITLSMHILLYLTHKFTIKCKINNDVNNPIPDSYEAIINYYCGKRIKIVTSVFIFLYSYGTCITYFIVLVDQISKVYITYHLDTFIITKNQIFIIVVTILILPLCFSKRINFLVISSQIGTVLLSYLPVMVTVLYYKYHHQSATVKPNVLLFNDCQKNNGNYCVLNNHFEKNLIYNLFTSFYDSSMTHSTHLMHIVPTICFLYNSQLSVVPIYHDMGDLHIKTWFNYSKAILVNIFVCAIFYNLVGIYSYLTFGAAVMNNPDILTAYSPSIPICLAIGILAFKIVVTYPLVLYCARVSLTNTFISPWMTSKMLTLIHDQDNNGNNNNNNGAASGLGGLHDGDKQTRHRHLSNGHENFTDPALGEPAVAFQQPTARGCIFARILAHSCGKIRALWNMPREQLIRICVSLAWFCSTVIFTLYVPDIGKIIPYLGSLSLLLLFVLPGTALMVDLVNIYEKEQLTFAQTNDDFSPSESDPLNSQIRDMAKNLEYGSISTTSSLANPAAQTSITDLFSSQTHANIPPLDTDLETLIPQVGPYGRACLFALSLFYIIGGTFLFGLVMAQSFIEHPLF